MDVLFHDSADCGGVGWWEFGTISVEDAATPMLDIHSRNSSDTVSNSMMDSNDLIVIVTSLENRRISSLSSFCCAVDVLGNLFEYD